jgi:mannobiose 2-epimerase
MKVHTVILSGVILLGVHAGGEVAKQDWTLETLRTSARNDLQQNILRFWLDNSIDEANGGFFGRITNNNVVVPDAPKGLVLNARILWTFSAAYLFDSKPEYLSTAGRAYDYIIANFMDAEFGGAYWMLDNKGKATDDTKELYGLSFVVYSLSEYYRATGYHPAIEEAKSLYDIIEAKCHDAKNKGYRETFSRDWKPAAKAQLAYGQDKATKTMNTHLHLMEAYTSLYRVWKDPGLKDSLREMVEVFRDHIIDGKTHHFRLFFDDEWNSTAETVSFGHDIEGSWLLCEAVEVLGDDELELEIKPIAIKMAQACYDEGLDTDGALLYEAEPTGITVRRKDWWPQAETVVGFLNAYELTGKEHLLNAAYANRQFILDRLVDKKYGEWFSVAPEGPSRPDDKATKASEWKAPYHNSRACMEIVRRTEKLMQRR